MKSRRVFWIAAVIALAACGGGGGGAQPPTQSHGSPTQAKTAALGITISIPTQSAMAKKRPLFVSPNTQSLAIYDYTGSTPPPTPVATPNVGPTAPGCTPNGAGTAITCTTQVVLPIGNSNLKIEALSGQNGSGSVLASATQNVTVATGMGNLPVVLDGTPAIIKLSLETPVLALGSAGSSILDVNAYDATGALIVAPGNFTSLLSISADSSAVSLSITTASAPGAQITVTYGGSSSAPYAVHIAGSGGGIASNLIIGSTLDLDPPQSMAFLSSQYYVGNAFGVSLLATTNSGTEPPQSLVSLQNNFTGRTLAYGGFAVLPSGAYAVDLYESGATPPGAYPCTLAVWPDTYGSLPYQPATYTPPAGSYGCPVAAEANGDLVAIDNGGGGSELTEYAVSTSGGGSLTPTGRTISLNGSQIPGGGYLIPSVIVTNKSGTIAIDGYLSTGGDAIFVYAAGASGAATPQSVPIGSSMPDAIAIDSSGGMYVSYNNSPSGYTVSEFNSSLSPTITISETPAPSATMVPQGLAVDAAGEVLVYQETVTVLGSQYEFVYGVDVYPASSTTLQRTVPINYAVGNGTEPIGPIIVPSPAPPTSSTAVSGDMIGYVASRTWTYVSQSSGDDNTESIGIYADPQLVNGNVRLVGYESNTSTNPFQDGTIVGSVDLTPLDGSYLAYAFSSVSSGTAGVSGTVPGTPLLVPGSLAINQTWNPLENQTIAQLTGATATAQVVATGAVPGIGACPSGSAASGATVQYSAYAFGNPLTGSGAQMSFVPGCGITSLTLGDGDSAVLSSVGSDPSLGQVTVPAGQPPAVAALHALWQHMFNVRPPKP